MSEEEIIFWENDNECVKINTEGEVDDRFPAPGSFTG